MRAFAFAFAVLSAAVPGAASRAAAPQRVASLNLCTDELLLMLGDPRQIASLSHLSGQAEETPFSAAARRHPLNDGSFASVVRYRPDLVLTMGSGGRDRARLAERLGVRLLDLPYPQHLADIERSIGQVAAALGRPAAGRALLTRIAALKSSRPSRPVDALWLGGGGRTVPASGLAADWMALAGLRQRAMAGDRVSLEQLLVHPPALLLRSDYRAGQYSGEQRWLSHPLARRVRARSIRTDGRLWTCMGPALAGEIARLRAAVR